MAPAMQRQKIWDWRDGGYADEVSFRFTFPNVFCGWLLHCKRFLAISAFVFVSTVVCPACLCGGVPLALMNSASEVPIGLSTLEEGR